MKLKLKLGALVAGMLLLGGTPSDGASTPVFNGCFEQCKNIYECWWDPDAYFCSAGHPFLPCDDWYEPNCIE